MKSTVRQFIISTWLFAVFVCHNPATNELVIGKHIMWGTLLLDRRSWFVHQSINSPPWTETGLPFTGRTWGAARCIPASFAEWFVVADLWQE